MISAGDLKILKWPAEFYSKSSRAVMLWVLERNVLQDDIRQKQIFKMTLDYFRLIRIELKKH